MVDRCTGCRPRGQRGPSVRWTGELFDDVPVPRQHDPDVAPQPQRPGKRGRNRRKTSHPDKVIYFRSNEQDFQETPSCQLDALRKEQSNFPFSRECQESIDPTFAPSSLKLARHARRRRGYRCVQMEDRHFPDTGQPAYVSDATLMLR
jgi:hypothetical protein